MSIKSVDIKPVRKFAEFTNPMETLKVLNVEQGDCETTVAPECLEANDLASSIGVSIIYQKHGFLLHSKDPFYEARTTIKRFLTQLSVIPKENRSSIHPLIAGSSLGTHPFDLPGYAIVRLKEMLRCRAEIERILGEAGFGTLQLKWAQPDEIHSLFLNLELGTITLTIDSRADDTRRTRDFAC